VAILSGDIKFFASKVMADVPDGGGGPTGVVIPDGASNAIFPDVSELDRAIGRVNIRQVVLGVTTPDTDTYLGANVIVAEPPNDPNVSVVIVQVDDLFARREQIKQRIESYLAAGPLYAGYLFGNMLAGQRTLTIAQRDGLPLPNIGDRIVLRKFTGQPSEVVQFVAVSSVSSLLRTFTDSAGEFNRRIVTLGLTDELLTDFPGFDALRAEPTMEAQAFATALYETVVADAARFYGAVALAEPASIGDFTVESEGIHVQIVPSAQAETPIADARTNNTSATLVAAGGPIEQTLYAAWSPAQALFVGSGILPGSVSVVSAGLTITDGGGRLMLSGAQVGVADYDNGILTLSADVFGGSAYAHVVTYTPAAVPITVSQSVGIPVSSSSRSLSYVVTLGVPARRSMSASYMSGGRWYTLREDGVGALRGADSAHGVGNLNYATGTLTLTLGALPDVGSAVVIQWLRDDFSTPLPSASLSADGMFYSYLNTDGAASAAPGSRPIAPGMLHIVWGAGGALSAHDDGFGALTGDATGFVDYQRGVVRWAPSHLPAADAVLQLKQESAPGVPVAGAVSTVATGVVWSGAGDARSASLGSAIVPGTLAFAMAALLKPTISGALPADTGVYEYDILQRETVTDDGAGALLWQGVPVGTVTYSTGALSIDLALSNSAAIAAEYEDKFGVYRSYPPTSEEPCGRNSVRLGSAPSMGLAFAWGVTFEGIHTSGGPESTVTYTTTGAATSAVAPVSVVVSQLFATVRHLAAGSTLQGVSFSVDGVRHVGAPDGVLRANISPTTGAGEPVGTVSSALGVVTLDVWQAGAVNTLADWRSVQAPPSAGTASPSRDAVILFRTASAPLRPGSFSLVGAMQDGTAINASAGVNGKIDHPRVKGRINFETGVVELLFCNPAPTGMGVADASYLQISGVTTVNLDAASASDMRYNAVAYSYIPLDADIIGINPVRLPSDGRVPVVRAGSVVVVGHTGVVGPATVSNGQTVSCARERLSRLRVIGQDGVAINTGYTADLEAGTATFTDVTGYSQPVTVEHRIEDMALVADAQINGTLRLTRPLTHEYPVPGSYVSSALLLGDVSARAWGLFDQYTWDGSSWADTVDGDVALGTYNDTLAPLEVTNDGALTERWALRFTSSSAFEIHGEHVGLIGTGTTGADCAPINPNSMAPYFTLRETGWGSGWVVGNVLRFNTVGAVASIPLVRVVQQGPDAGINYTFSIHGRGDVDRP